MDVKKQNMIGAIRLWATGQGMCELGADKDDAGTDISFSKDGFYIGFVFEFDKTKDAFLQQTQDATGVCDFIYAVIDDSKKRSKIAKSIPEEMGILCYSNSFGLGNVYQLFKEPEFIV